MIDIDGRPELNFKLFPGEKEAVETVLKAGKEYGYGNMIAHLKQAWIKMLMEKYHSSYDMALIAADVLPYRNPSKGEAK